MMTGNDYGYSPSHMMQQPRHLPHHPPRNMYMDSKNGQGPNGGQHGNHNGNAPNHQGHNGGHGDFTQMMNSHHPHQMNQHHHQGEFDHEPLVLNIQNNTQGFYQPMNTPMLHVSTDFASTISPAMSPGIEEKSMTGQKRSREELNMKEKKRMFKLNETIHTLKAMLDEAGVSSKKNKQSILDNTAHYITMLRNDLLIAKQKVERAEHLLESQRGDSKGGLNRLNNNAVDMAYKRYFEYSSTPTMIISLDMNIISCNKAFREATGLSQENLKNKDVLLSCLSIDASRARSLVHSAIEGRKTIRSVVQNGIASGRVTSSLSLTVVADNNGNPECLECVVIPLEDEQNQYEVLKEDTDSKSSSMHPSSSGQPSQPSHHQYSHHQSQQFHSQSQMQQHPQSQIQQHSQPQMPQHSQPQYPPHQQQQQQHTSSHQSHQQQHIPANGESSSNVSTLV